MKGNSGKNDKVRILFDQEVDELLDLSGDKSAQAAYEDELQRAALLIEARETRLANGQIQEQVAIKMGVTQSMISDLENGKVDPQLSTIQKWARAIGRRLDVVLAHPDEPKYALTANSELRKYLEDISLQSLFMSLVKDYQERSKTLKELSHLVPTMVPRPLISYLLESLTENGWTTASGVGEDRTYSLHPRNIIGVSVHANSIRAALLDLDAKVIGKLHYLPISDSEYGTVIKGILSLVEKLHHESEKEILGVGISIAGVIDQANGVVNYAPHVTNQTRKWTKAELCRDLEASIRANVSTTAIVSLENDANALALWERLTHRVDPVAVILMTAKGIGSGFVVNGKPIHGKHGAAGEVGHIIIDPTGKKCHFNLPHRGCLETIASVEGILKELGIPFSSPEDRESGLHEAEEMVSRGDEHAHEAFSNAGRAVGRLYATTIGMLDPGRGVIYGNPYLINQKYSTGRSFRNGFMHALEESSSSHLLHLGDPVVHWEELHDSARATAAGTVALWRFLMSPRENATSHSNPTSAHMGQ